MKSYSQQIKFLLLGMSIRRYLIYFRYFDWILFFSVLLLLSFSLAALYGIAQGFDPANFSQLYKQIIFIFIGIGFLIFFSLLNYNIFLSYAYPLYISGCIFLLVVLFFGKTFQGTTGWFELFGFTFQPVEFSKFALIVTLSKIFSRTPPEKRDWKFIMGTGFVTFIYIMLVLKQPDFGSAVILFAIWFGLMLLAGVKRVYLFALIAIFAAGLIFGWFFLFQDFQKDRIKVFFNPSADPLGRGYHVRQSIIAIGSGGLLGRGLASGSQSQLKFIPASQTDFIFAVIGEELGFLGSGVVLVLYFIFLYRMLRTAGRTNDNFAVHFVLSCIILFLTQIAVNIGMNLGIMPVTGISLPYLSYGGSFLILSLALVGVVQSIYIRTVKYQI